MNQCSSIFLKFKETAASLASIDLQHLRCKCTRMRCDVICSVFGEKSSQQDLANLIHKRQVRDF